MSAAQAAHEPVPSSWRALVEARETSWLSTGGQDSSRIEASFRRFRFRAPHRESQCLSHRGASRAPSVESGDAVRTISPTPTDGSVPIRTGGALEQVPEDLQRLLAGVRRAASEAALAEAKHAYAVAKLSLAATGRIVPAGRGAALGKCADLLGYSRQKLQSYGPIATRWTADQFLGLFQLSGSSRTKLSTSHLLLLAPLPRSKGELWIARVLENGMTVRELKDCLQDVDPDAQPSVHDRPSTRSS